MKRIAICLALACVGLDGRAEGQDEAPGAPEAENPAIRALLDALDDAYDRGDAKAVAALYLPKAERIDLEGDVAQGREAIAEAFEVAFEALPGASIRREVESIRTLGAGLAIEDGTAVVLDAEGGEALRMRYVRVLNESDQGWRVANAREFPDDEAPVMPGDRLEPLAWLVGDWVAEGAEHPIALAIKRSDDGNYLLAEYTLEPEGGPALSTMQRIGWDPSHRVVRSWTFDSDGGFAEGRWSPAGDSWVVRSTLVLPDGLTGSATFYLTPASEDRFTWLSVDRVVDGIPLPDAELTIVRKPPSPGAPDADAESSDTDPSTRPAP